jgi:hypothetical protein
MDFRTFYDFVCEHYDVSTQGQVAKLLGVHPPTINRWLNVSGPRRSTWKKLLARLAANVTRDLVWDILEFEPFLPHPAGGSWSLHSDPHANAALRAKLDGKMGLYVFYDSAYRVLYVGKSASNLGFEVRQRLNGRVNRAVYAPAKKKGVKMGHLARYLSAYEVYPKEAIHNLEVLLLRAFANDTANTNIGHFRFTPR